MTRAGSLTRDARATVVPWLLARVLVGAAFGVARFVFDQIGHGRRPAALRQGLFAWDAAFYRAIAAHGYARHGGSLRFFPLLPMLTRAIGWLTGTGVALILIVNVSTFVVGVLLVRLTRHETGDEAVAERAVWLMMLAPPASVFVLGYAESVFVALAIVAFIGLRTRRWWVAAAAGALAALARPVGIFLVVPAAIEVARGWSGAAWRERLAGVVAALAPVVGTWAYLGWVGARFGDPWLPISLQQSKKLRGGLEDPFRAVGHATTQLIHGDRAGSGLHVLWAVLLVGLLVVAFRKLPCSYGAFAAISLVSALSARNLDSLERYGLAAFPFVIAGALLIRSESVARPVLVLAGAGLFGYSILVFLGLSVP